MIASGPRKKRTYHAIAGSASQPGYRGPPAPARPLARRRLAAGFSAATSTAASSALELRPDALPEPSASRGDVVELELLQLRSRREDVGVVEEALRVCGLERGAPKRRAV